MKIAAMTHAAGTGVGVTATVNFVDNRVEALVGDGEGDQQALVFAPRKISFNGLANTLTRSDGLDWADDGFEKGQWIRIANLSDESEDGLYRIDDVTGGVLTLTPGAKSPGSISGTDVVIEKIGRIQLGLSYDESFR